MRGGDERPHGGVDLVLDIETIAAPSRLQIALAGEEVRAPANYRDPDKIEAYRQESLAKWASKCALSPATGRLACLGVCPADEPHNVGVMLDESEHSMVAALDKVLSSYSVPVRIVTFSGRGFDLPFLIVRSAVCAFRPEYPLPWRRYDPRHVDLRDILADGSLEHWEVALLGQRKTSHGSEVQSMWDAGRYDEIRAHCQEDVLRTAEIWRMLKPVLE